MSLSGPSASRCHPLRPSLYFRLRVLWAHGHHVSCVQLRAIAVVSSDHSTYCSPDISGHQQEPRGHLWWPPSPRPCAFSPCGTRAPRLCIWLSTRSPSGTCFSGLIWHIATGRCCWNLSAPPRHSHRSLSPWPSHISTVLPFWSPHDSWCSWISWIRCSRPRRLHDLAGYAPYLHPTLALFSSFAPVIQNTSAYLLSELLTTYDATRHHTSTMG